mmetsp:Transcript_130676/g.226040  ORF Transcript_130676/g.226040 Transcript_130676/m.226040 type:complete len:248 (-) Transcript_130676:485-1228(-)
MCDVERRMLNGEKISAANEIEMAQDEYAALKSENELLKDDNNELSLDIAELERFVDDLREELDDKDFISDDEAEALEETLALGNNSKGLAELLESASFSEENDIVVGKDELISLLISEMKTKRSALVNCMHEKKVMGKTDMQMMWEDMNDDQRKAILRAMVKKIATLMSTNPTQAEEMIQTWGKRHYREAQGLRDDVQARLARKQQTNKENLVAGSTEEKQQLSEDFDDDLWSEWDWDDDEATGERP